MSKSLWLMEPINFDSYVISEVDKSKLRLYSFWYENDKLHTFASEEDACDALDELEQAHKEIFEKYCYKPKGH